MEGWEWKLVPVSVSFSIFLLAAEGKRLEGVRWQVVNFTLEGSWSQGTKS